MDWKKKLATAAKIEKTTYHLVGDQVLPATLIIQGGYNPKDFPVSEPPTIEDLKRAMDRIKELEKNDIQYTNMSTRLSVPNGYIDHYYISVYRQNHVLVCQLMCANSKVYIIDTNHKSQYFELNDPNMVEKVIKAVINVVRTAKARR